MRLDVKVTACLTWQEIDTYYPEARDKALDSLRDLSDRWYEPTVITDYAQSWLDEITGGGIDIYEWDAGRAQSVSFRGSTTPERIRVALASFVAEYCRTATADESTHVALMLAMPTRTDWEGEASIVPSGYGQRLYVDPGYVDDDVDERRLSDWVDAWETWLDNLRGEVFSLIRQDVEYRYEDEYLIDMAEGNGIEFTPEGEIA